MTNEATNGGPALGERARHAYAEMKERQKRRQEREREERARDTLRWSLAALQGAVREVLADPAPVKYRVAHSDEFDAAVYAEVDGVWFRGGHSGKAPYLTLWLPCPSCEGVHGNHQAYITPADSPGELPLAQIGAALVYAENRVERCAQDKAARERLDAEQRTMDEAEREWEARHLREAARQEEGREPEPPPEIVGRALTAEERFVEALRDLVRGEVTGHVE